MKWLKIPFLLIWRAWFYILMVVTILIMFPFLLVLTSHEKYYPVLWKMIRIWSFILIYGMGFWLKITREQEMKKGVSYVVCPNHTSLMDPFIMIALCKNPVVFVGKKELAKLPIFGFFYKKVVILVDRSDAKSRKQVYRKVKNRLQEGLSVAFFPEGLVPVENVILSSFKKGAFSLSINLKIPIVPHVYYDAKRLFSWDFFKGGPGIFRVKQCKFIQTKQLTNNHSNSLKQQTFDIIYNELKNDKLYMKDTNRSNNDKEFRSLV